MMLSTSPNVPEHCKIPSASAALCTANFVAQNGKVPLGFLHNRQLLKGSALQLDEDSTDIGSAMSSDAEMPNSSSFSSPSCSDNEAASVDRKPLKQPRAFLKPNSKRGNFKSTPLETIQGTPAGMSEHPPLFFPPGPIEASMETMDSMDAPISPAALPKPVGFIRFSAPPGLSSPQRSRKPKGMAAQTLLATAPKLPSPRRSRKPKSGVAQSFLATGPENLLNEAHVFPPSPTRRARSDLIDKAKLDGAPLKVQMEGFWVESGFVKKLLDPTQPVKKKPIFSDVDQCFQKLKPGEPVKKHVTPWLVAEPLATFAAMPR